MEIKLKWNNRKSRIILIDVKSKVALISFGRVDLAFGILLAHYKDEIEEHRE